MLKIIPVEIPELAPLTTVATDLAVLNQPLDEYLPRALAALTGEITWRADFIPSPELIDRLAVVENFVVIDPATGETLAAGGEAAIAERFPAEGFRLRFPWDLLAVNEALTARLDSDRIEGEVLPGVHIDGHITLGSGSRLLPGVYIEGNVIIGSGCKIGPNCYLRGNSVIGDGVHIGQAVEIKNSILGDKVSVGHLSYAGDSVICNNVNFGAGTIISNLRHDGRNHRWLENQEFLDTGRVEDGVHVPVLVTADTCAHLGDTGTASVGDAAVVANVFGERGDVRFHLCGKVVVPLGDMPVPEPFGNGWIGFEGIGELAVVEFSGSHPPAAVPVVGEGVCSVRFGDPDLFITGYAACTDSAGVGFQCPEGLLDRGHDL